jgi:16S rRNA (cytosine967-C5)-methyltransferase
VAISPARTAAFDILMQVEREDAYASELLHGARYANLSSADHGLATELVMGVLRWRSRLDEAIARESSLPFSKIDSEVLTALRMAAYQLFFLERVPHRAAIHESVELVKRARKSSAAPFANAVLRKLAKQEKSDSADLAHPAWMVERWSNEFGDEIARKICEYDQRVPKTTIRSFDAAAISELENDGIRLEPGGFLTSAYRIASGDITKTSAFLDGRVAVQDEGSQLVALLAGKGKRILDCCAAPGGKTRILARRNPEAKVVAVELHEHRANLLRRLVSEKNVEVITADVCELPVGEKFDCVLADAPCSGTGTLAHNPEIKWRLRLEDLRDLQGRQISILRAAMNQVAPGGRLTYSTCSLEREENEEVVERALTANSEFHLQDCRVELKRLQEEGEMRAFDADAITNGKYLRTIPGVQACDGFFAAVLRRG